MNEVQLNFTPESLFLLNILIAYIMFGVSMSIKKEDFLLLVKEPKPVLVGLISQFIILPALTYLLIIIFNIDYMIALGMILVAACPGGPVSNFFASISKANVALSISLTTLATILAILMTPINFQFWGNLLANQEELQVFSLSFFDMIKTVFLIIGVPVVLGLWVGSHFPKFVVKSSSGIRISSFVILILFIAAAFAKNFNYFLDYIQEIFLIVLIHNAIAFIGAYIWARFTKNSEANCRTITMETGIQNSALALIVIFNFFDGNGPMALITAWWGVWHLISGTILSQFWRRKLIQVQ